MREFPQKESDDVSEQLGWIISKARLNYLDKNPDMFNWWMTQFKGFCHGKTGPESDTWDFIVAGGYFDESSTLLSSFRSDVELRNEATGYQLDIHPYYHCNTL